MNSSNIFSRLSTASASAVRMLAEAKVTVQSVADTAQSMADELTTASMASASTETESGMKTEILPASENDERVSDDTSAPSTNVSGMSPNTLLEGAHNESEISRCSKTSPTESLVSQEGTVISNNEGNQSISDSTTNTASYMSRFRQIALLASQASPATSKMIAGHAQTVANSVAVAAKNAAYSVEATKTAIMSRQEASAKVCSHCGTGDNLATMVTSFASRLEHCQVCDALLCGACCKRCSFILPEGLSHPDSIQGRKTFYLCKHNPCNRKVCKILLSNFQLIMREKYDMFYKTYFDDGEVQGFYYFMPDSTEDTVGRKALRLAQVAEIVLEQLATATGFALTFKAVKYAYYGRELMNVIINDHVLSALGPVFEALNHFGIKGPSGLLAVYYLACSNDLRRKIDPSNESRGYRPGDSGVVCTPCCTPLVSHVSQYLAAAQWLYLAKLPAPHDSNEWSSWYLTRLVAKHGWTLLVSINEATQLPDGSRCPAFALVVRDGDREGGGEAQGLGQGLGQRRGKECLLVIRGTASTMDWSINMDDLSVPLIYRTGSMHPPHIGPEKWGDKEGAESAGESERVGSEDGRQSSVSGLVHAGMHRGALGILDGYGMREYLLDLGGRGFELKIVGHSLGAGTAVMIAAELKNSFMEILDIAHTAIRPSPSHSLPSSPPPPPAQKPLIPADTAAATPPRAWGMEGTGDMRGEGQQGPERGASADAPPLSPSSLSLLAAMVKGVTPRIAAVAFATPPCVCETLATAFGQGDTPLVVSVILGEDPIPRFSRANVISLAAAAKRFLPTAERWKQEDMAALRKYAVTCGKASSPMGPSEEGEAEVEAAISTRVESSSSVVEGIAVSVQVQEDEAENERERERAVRTRTESLDTHTRSTDNATLPPISPAPAPASTPYPPAVEDGPAGFRSSSSSTVRAGYSMQSVAAAAASLYSDSLSAVQTAGFAQTQSLSAFKPDSWLPHTDKTQKEDYFQATEACGEQEGDFEGDVDDIRSLTVTVDPDDRDRSSSSSSEGSASGHIDAPRGEGCSSSAPPLDPTSCPPIITPTVTIMVPPGRIIHIYKHNGMFTTSEIAHTHPTLRRLVPYVELGVDDHRLYAYRRALKAVLSTLQTNTNTNIPTHTTSTSTFSSSSEPVGVANSSSLEGEGEGGKSRRPELWQSIATSGAALGDDIDIDTALQKPGTEGEGGSENEKERVLEGKTAGRVQGGGSEGGGTCTDPLAVPPSSRTPHTGGRVGGGTPQSPSSSAPWVPCVLCGLDCTWVYIMHSDAARALVTHRCNSCGKVVCSVCSPSGDKIPGDGINRSLELKDYRVVLPHLGDLGPKRVCLHCYLDS